MAFTLWFAFCQVLRRVFEGVVREKWLLVSSGSSCSHWFCSYKNSSGLSEVSDRHFQYPVSYFNICILQLLYRAKWPQQLWWALWLVLLRASIFPEEISKIRLWHEGAVCSGDNWSSLRASKKSHSHFG